jgi:hypothetical protein
MAKQRHRVRQVGQRWKVEREDRPLRRDEHAMSFSTKEEAEQHRDGLNDYWERGMGERR